LAGDLHAKHPFRKSAVSTPSEKKLLELLDVNEFEISAPQYGYVLDIVVHNIKLLLVTILISWTQITYQQYSTYWITLKLGIFQN
jgi:protein associated with RNAse G/E